MKIFRAPWMILLLTAPLLAGCLGGDDLPVTELSDFLVSPDERVHFTWPDQVAYDGQGNPVDVPEAMPHVVQTRLDAASANSRVVASPQTGSLFVIGQQEVLDRYQVYRSTDSGLTWEAVLKFTPVNYPESYNYLRTLHGSLGVDPETGRVFASQIFPSNLCTTLFWSDADGEEGTWEERPLACNNPVTQPCWSGSIPWCAGYWQTLTVAPGLGGALELPTPASSYPSLLMSCRAKTAGFPVGTATTAAAAVAAQAGVPVSNPTGTACAFSGDGGETYLYESQALPPVSGCDSIAAQPAVFPDGAIAVPRGAIGIGCHELEPTVVAVTSDAGVTWDQRQCTGATSQREMEPALAITPDGTAYLLYRDQNHTIQLARSSDQFETCDIFQVSPPENTLNVFTALSVGSDGRIAMAYMGTKQPQDEEKWVDIIAPGHAVPETHWHLFVTTSFDADTDDPTFVTQQVTPWEDPVQLGCIWSEDHPALSDCSHLGQMITMTSDAAGRFYVAFAESCVPRIHCSGDPWQADYQSRELSLAVAILDSGPGLQADDVASLGLEHPQPYPRIYAPEGDGGDGEGEGSG